MADETLQYDSADRLVADQTVELSCAATDTSGDLPVSFGRYRITGVLGEGGFGKVYRGFDEELQREVAIKVPHRKRVSTPAGAKNYLIEAQTVANLDHPHIVPVFDVGSTPHFPCFIVSKYVDGTDLARRLKQSPLAIRESVELVATVAEALHHAHKQGLVHRDVKPGNILLDKTGKPFVADFGLALREQDAPQQSSYVGTPSYMSPEQARGEGHRVDARSDVFSLGVVLYELLTGRKPFRADSEQELLEKIVNYEPPPLRQRDERLPKELDRICLKALSKRVAERYSTASDMAEDLRHFLAHYGGQQQTGTGNEGRDSAAITPLLPMFAPPEVTPAITPAFKRSESRLINVMPKGLRSYDADDADFFMELLPGPRDREGLPESIRFWKTRIEEQDGDNTFKVGLLYGPSGCGKSSLVKAGLLTRLSPDVITVYVEATADGTETRLLHALRKRCPELASNLTLAKTLAALRRGHGLAPQHKVLIVLDQFEQWLHARNDVQGDELVSALRQCDGGHVQCMVMVRDDFWLAVSRFMRGLEIELVQGKNMALVDLFDLRHAKKVLASFGRAFGALPDGAGHLGRNEEAFLDQAASGLAQGGKIIPVRLSVFAEMVKHKPWTPATLAEVGGMEGVGVTFLDETFATSTAAPQYRVHRKAAQAVLRALVPETGTDIKGKMRSEQELLAESGYAAQPDNFTALMRILDGELRLITPTDPDDEESVSQAGQKYYQLTHDYLVHSLRDWLTRTQRATRRGRAELLLAERAAEFGPQPDARFLPGWLEWPTILLFTKHRKWTAPQRRLMSAANKHHGLRLIVFLVAAALAVFAGVESHRRGEARRAQTLAESVFTAPPDAVRYTLDNLLEVGRLAKPALRAKLDDPQADPVRRLRAAFALAELGEAPLEFLLESVATAPGAECGNLVTALGHAKEAALTELVRRAESVDELSTRLRLATVALQLGETGLARQALAIRSDPSQRTAWIHGFAGWHGDVAHLAALLETTDDPNFRSGMCAALGTIEPPTNERQAAVKTLKELYTTATDGGTHSAAGWALRQWQETLPSLQSGAQPKRDRGWFVNRRGMTMLKVPAGSFTTMDTRTTMGADAFLANGDSPLISTEPNAICNVRLTKPFFICDRELWVDLFREFITEASSDEAPPDWKMGYFKQSSGRGGEVPVQLVTWDDAVRFCNWLSRQEQRRPCYRLVSGGSAKDAADKNAAPSPETWEWDRAADGYRLPTEAEWEYACRAGAATKFCYGDDSKLLGSYAVCVINADGAPRPGRQKLPNGWGLFDVHGNVAEWCYDWFAAYPAAATDPAGPTEGTERVYRGGSFFDQYPGMCYARVRGKYAPNQRPATLGFRVVVSDAGD